jgi:small-conductance mechanosensitive channel
MKNPKVKWWLLFILLFALAGYFREFLFVHMNNIMYMNYYHKTSILKVPSFMKVFETWDYATLYYSKYFFTIAWVIVFYLLNYFTLKKLCDVPVFRRYLLYSYCMMFLISAIAMGYGYLTKNTLLSDEYTVSRWLMGVAQSPIISLILLASEKLYFKSRS